MKDETTKKFCDKMYEKGLEIGKTEELITQTTLSSMTDPHKNMFVFQLSDDLSFKNLLKLVEIGESIVKDECNQSVRNEKDKMMRLPI